MMISVKQIALAQVPEQKNKPGIYWIEFESAQTSGPALLHSERQPNELLGRNIHVEFSYNSIKDFQILKEKHPPHSSCLTHLATACDYEVTGQVVVPCDEVFYVAIMPGQGSFCISLNEIGHLTVRTNDWVNFKLQGLELWDVQI